MNKKDKIWKEQQMLEFSKKADDDCSLTDHDFKIQATSSNN